MAYLSHFFDDFFFFNRVKSKPFIAKNLALSSDENDTFLLKVISCYWLTSLGITLYFDTYMLGIVGGGLINALAWLSYSLFQGMTRRFLFCFCLCLYSALFIHQQPGYVEPHFSFYATVYLLTRYKDVRPLLIFASMTLLYYLLFTYLQSKSVNLFAMNIELYTWGLWDAFRYHIIAFLLSTCVFAIIIRNHIIDFEMSQLLQLDLLEKKQGLKKDIANRTELVSRKTNKLKTMLNSLSEGLLIIDPDLCIHPQYTLFLEKILAAENLAGKPAIEVLFRGSNLNSNDIANVKLVLDVSLGKPSVHFENNQHLLIKQYSIKTKTDEKHLHIQWHPICNDQDEVEQVLVSIYDRSLIKQLRQNTEKSTLELQLIGEVLMVEQQVFCEFMNDTQQTIKYSVNLALNNVNEQTKVCDEILTDLNKIKESAWTLGLVYLTRKVQETESHLEKVLENNAWDLRDCSDKISLLSVVIEEYNTLNFKLGRVNANSTRNEWLIEKSSVKNLLTQISLTENNTEAEIVRSLQTAKNYISALGAKSIAQIIQPIINSLTSLAAEQGKIRPEFELDNGDILLSSAVVASIGSAISQLTQNSLIHGIEQSNERLKKHKSERGKITCRCQLSESGLLIQFYDDGQGLNLAVIKEKAMSDGLLLNANAVNNEDIANFIFKSRYSNTKPTFETSQSNNSLYAIKKQLQSCSIDIRVKLLDIESNNNLKSPFEVQLQLPINALVQNNEWLAQ